MKDWDRFFRGQQSQLDEQVETHLESEFYDMEGFRSGKNSLRHIELEELGPVNGKSLLHLQCHFGQDTLSWARLGAEVTGVDISGEAIKTARKLSEELSIPGRFIECGVYELPDQHEEQYDIVFTSYGTIGWLPDLDRWAAVVNRFLKPGGVFFIADFHPVLWMLDDKTFQTFQYDYFNTGVIDEEEESTYAEPDKKMALQTFSWNHALSDTFQALIDQGIRIEAFKEYPYAPWPCFPGLKSVGPEQWVFEQSTVRIPMTYMLKGRKPV